MTRKGQAFADGSREELGKGKACHPQKHLGRDEPVEMRQCVHLVNEATKRMSTSLCPTCTRAGDTKVGGMLCVPSRSAATCLAGDMCPRWKRGRCKICPLFKSWSPAGFSCCDVLGLHLRGEGLCSSPQI